MINNIAYKTKQSWHKKLSNLMLVLWELCQIYVQYAPKFPDICLTIEEKTVQIRIKLGLIVRDATVCTTIVISSIYIFFYIS